MPVTPTVKAGVAEGATRRKYGSVAMTHISVFVKFFENTIRNSPSQNLRLPALFLPGKNIKTKNGECESSPFVLIQHDASKAGRIRPQSGWLG